MKLAGVFQLFGFGRGSMIDLILGIGEIAIVLFLVLPIVATVALIMREIVHIARVIFRGHKVY
jgi:hypothetical protein